jgi:hypothetical protein
VLCKKVKKARKQRKMEQNPQQMEVLQQMEGHHQMMVEQVADNRMPQPKILIHHLKKKLIL